MIEWVLEYRYMYHGHFQAFPLTVERFVVPQEFTNIQTLLSTLQEPANDVYKNNNFPLC